MNPFASCDIAYINGPSDNPVYVSIDGVLYDKQQKKLISYPGAKEGAYTIPKGTLHIGDYAFLRCERLTVVTIPDSVTSIGEAAFTRCERLTVVTIPDSVTSIGDWAFSHCYNLASLTLPDGVASIGIYAFWKSSLTDVTIPASVTYIDHRAFDGCEELILTVAKGSYAEKYALSNGIPYVSNDIPIPDAYAVAYDAKDYQLRGRAYLDQGQYDLAIADYTAAIALDPNLSVAYNNRGHAYHCQEQYTQAIELNPGYVIAYQNRANAYEATGDMGAAESDRLKAEELNGNLP